MSFGAESWFPPPQSVEGKDGGGEGHFGRVRQSLRLFEYANESRSPLKPWRFQKSRTPISEIKLKYAPSIISLNLLSPKNVPTWPALGQKLWNEALKSYPSCQWHCCKWENVTARKLQKAWSSGKERARTSPSVRNVLMNQEENLGMIIWDKMATLTKGSPRPHETIL